MDPCLGHTIGSGSVVGLNIGSAEGSLHGLDRGIHFLNDEVDDGISNLALLSLKHELDPFPALT